MSSSDSEDIIVNSDSEYEDVYQRECCSDSSLSSNISSITLLVNVLADIFVTPQIQDAMKTVIRDHFMWNTGAKIKSVHYNLGELTNPGDYHVCFAPRRELNTETVFVDILEHLQLRPGHHFLHLGSGTGYLNTLVGLLIGCRGVNHGIEVNQGMLEYAEERQQALRDHCAGLHLYDYCEPNFILGDCLKLDPEIHFYDRIYCSGKLPEGYENFLKLFLRPCGGVLMFPANIAEKFTVIHRHGETYLSQNRASVSNLLFYPFKADLSPDGLVELPPLKFPSLQSLCRGVIREQVRFASRPKPTVPTSQKRESDFEEPQESKKLKLKNESESDEHESKNLENGHCETGKSSKETGGTSKEKLQNGELNEQNLSANSEKSQSSVNSIHYKEIESDAEDSLSLSSVQSSVKSFEHQDFSQDSHSSPENISYRRNVIRPAGSSSSNSDYMMNIFSDSSSDHLELDPEDDTYEHRPAPICTECHVVTYADRPIKMEPFNPNKSYAPDHLNTKIGLLPLPEHLLLYLKYKHDMLNN